MTGVTLAIIVIVNCGAVAAAALSVRMIRRGIAASLVAEIAQSLDLIEAHNFESGSATSQALASPLPWLFSPVVYPQFAARIGLLGAHRARLIASFYASARVLSDELRALATETSETSRIARTKFAVAEMQVTLDLGDEALRSLRPLISRRRQPSLSRA